MVMGHIGSDCAPGFYLDGAESGSVQCDRGIPRFRHNSRAPKQPGISTAALSIGIETIRLVIEWPGMNPNGRWGDYTYSMAAKCAARAAISSSDRPAAMGVIMAALTPLRVPSR